MCGKASTAGQRGATLLELLVLLTLLGISLPAIISMVSSLYVHHAVMQARLQAVQLAQQELEKLRFYRDAHWDWFLRTREMEQMVEKVEGYQMTVNIEKRHVGKANVPLWRVRVRVSHKNLSQPVVLETYFARYQKGSR